MTTTARHITLNSAAALITIVVGLLTAGSMVGGYLVDNHRRDAITQHRHDATTQRLNTGDLLNILCLRLCVHIKVLLLKLCGQTQLNAQVY